MELRHLRYFIAVAEELNYRKAAERLFISQPPLSKQIINLEKELDTLLLRRSKRKVELTAAGKTFYKRAKTILESVDNATTETRQIHNGDAGKLTIGFLSAITLAGFPSFLNVFRERHPNVEVLFQQLSAEEQIDAVVSGNLDIGFVDMNSFSLQERSIGQKITSTLVSSKNYVVVAVPEKHRLASKKTIDVEELCLEEFIFQKRQFAPSFYDICISLCREGNFSPNVKYEVSQLPIALTMVQSGYGITLAPKFAARINYLGVVFIPLKQKVSVPISMIARAGDDNPIQASLHSIVMKQNYFS